MFEIMTVCTGNICRSPLAELMLRTRLAGLPGAVSSAGTQGLDSAPMPEEAQRLAAGFNIPANIVAEHRSRWMTPAHLQTPDLILAMAREHRRAIVEIDPRRLRSTFTVREFARLAEDAADDEIVSAARAHSEAGAQLRAAVEVVAGHRGLVMPPADPEQDDVVDPYRRSWNTYQRSADELAPAIDQVVRVVRLAVSPA